MMGNEWSNQAPWPPRKREFLFQAQGRPCIRQNAKLWEPKGVT